MADILLIGTLDTKGQEFAYVRGLIEQRGHTVTMLDAGIYEAQGTEPDIVAEEVAAAGDGNLEALRDAGDRGMAMAVMQQGVIAITQRLYDAGLVDGVLGLGGSGGTTLATAGMQALPTGIPKVMVSTLASGDVAPYVGVKDIAMMYSVVDIAGLNRISRQVLSNAVGMICGAVEQSTPEADDKALSGCHHVRRDNTSRYAHSGTIRSAWD